MITRVVIGFVAAMLAVLLVHQPIIAGLAAAGILPPTAVAYNMAPLPNGIGMIAQTMTSFGFKGWPTLFNLMFWGGLWGVLFGLVLAPLSMPHWLKGLLLGLLVVVVGNWLLVPLFKGQALFSGFDPKRMGITAMINIPFGLATGLIYGLFQRSRD